ncbi:MAG: oligosaccharide flippase family protein, partial [Nitrososphaera sp.]
MLRRIFKNIGALTVATVLSRALSFYINIYLARTLGPSGLGQISLAQSVIVYFSLITDLGLKTYATNQITGRLAQSRPLLNRIFSLRILLGIISFLICQCTVYFFPLDGETKSLIMRMS